MAHEWKENEGRLPCDAKTVICVEYENGKRMDGYLAGWFDWYHGPEADQIIAHGYQIKRWRVTDTPAIA